MWPSVGFVVIVALVGCWIVTAASAAAVAAFATVVAAATAGVAVALLICMLPVLCPVPNSIFCILSVGLARSKFHDASEVRAGVDIFLWFCGATNVM